MKKKRISLKQKALKDAYRKERRRIQSILYRGKKQGYIFSENALPEIPKRITQASLKRLQKITSKDLYKKAEYLYIETGEIVPAKQRKAEVKKQAIEKAKITRAIRKIEVFEGTYSPDITAEFQQTASEEYIPTISIIERIRDEIINLTREANPPIPIEQRKNQLLSIFDDTINEYQDNIHALEDYLLQHESEIGELLYQVAYDSGGKYEVAQNKIEFTFARLGELLNMGTLSPSQAEGLSHMTEYI